MKKYLIPFIVFICANCFSDNNLSIQSGQNGIRIINSTASDITINVAGDEHCVQFFDNVSSFKVGQAKDLTIPFGDDCGTTKSTEPLSCTSMIGCKLIRSDNQSEIFSVLDAGSDSNIKCPTRPHVPINFTFNYSHTSSNSTTCSGKYNEDTGNYDYTIKPDIMIKLQ